MNYEEARNKGLKIGYTVSTFDVLHAGHAAMLAEAKSTCDYLVVGLLSDPTNDRPDEKNKPIQSLFERWVQLSAIKYVDEIVPVETEQDIYDSICVVRPDIRILGSEYKDKNFTGNNLPTEMHFNSRTHSFSSSELRTRIEERGDD